MKSKITYLIALSLGILSACTYPSSSTGAGALTGGAVGAGTGAIVGAATGKVGPAIAIGAGVGAIGGALVGNSMDAQEAERKRLEEEQYRQSIEIERQNREIEEIRRQQRYDDAYQKY